MKVIPQWQFLKEYVDSNIVTTRNLVTSTFNKWMWGSVINVGLIATLSLFGGKKCYNDYQSYQEQVGDYAASILVSQEKGNISKRDAQKQLDKLNKNKIDPNKEIIGGIMSLSPSKVLIGIKHYWNPGIVKTQLEGIAVENNSIFDKNIKSRTNLESALKLYDESCSLKDDTNYHITLNKFEETGLDSKPFEDQFLKAEYQCEERSYFDGVRNELMKKAKQLKASSMPAREIAREIFYDYCNETERNGRSHQEILRKKTEGLSREITSEIGFVTHLEACL